MNEQQKIEQANILEIRSAYECYMFARDAKCVDIQALQAKLLEIGIGEDEYYSARDVEGSDIQALKAR